MKLFENSTFPLIALILLSSFCGQGQNQTLNQTPQAANRSASPAGDTIKVLTFTKDCNTKKCDSLTALSYLHWILDSNQMNLIFEKLEVISAEDWHHLFKVLNCKYVGTMLRNGITYNFEINAGAWVVLYNAHETIYLGDEKSQFRNYFIEKVWTPEDEK